jgi:hypothetical protein
VRKIMEKAELFSKRNVDIPDFRKFPGATSLRKILDGGKWVWKASYGSPDEGWRKSLMSLRKDLLKRMMR